jgi:hypothetical protein
MLGIDLAFPQIAGWFLIIAALFGFVIIYWAEMNQKTIPLYNTAVINSISETPIVSSNNQLLCALYKLSDSLGTDAKTVESNINKSITIAKKLDMAALNTVRRIAIMSKIAQDEYDSTENKDNAKLELYKKQTTIDLEILSMPKILNKDGKNK